MSIYVTDRTRKVGRPPGEIVHVGERKTEPVQMRVIDYDDGSITEREVERVEELYPYRDAPTVSWINVDGVHDTALIEQIGKHFGLHPLVLEDIANTGQRPKVEEHDDRLFIVTKMVYVAEERARLHAEQVSLIVGPRFVLSFHEDPGDVFEPVRQRLRQHRGRIRKADADYLAYSLLDVIVDHYFIVLEQIGEEIEEMEEHVLSDPSQEAQQHINRLRRDLVLMRRVAWPMRELLSVLNRTDSPLVSESTRPFFRDVYDHAVQVLDIVESLRDVMAGLTDLYMTSLSNRLNEVMKVLTIVGTIFIPLTFLAGIYGMNFEYMPELQYPYAYPIALLGMAAIGVAMAVFFHRKNWL